MPAPVVTLLTDFGTADTYVGQMHGVIASICPAARVIDLTHAVPPQDVAIAGYWLRDAIEACAPGTVHVAVTDPGVGSARRAIAASIGDWLFVAPDNGLLSAVLADWPCHDVVELTDVRFHRSAQSTTFHGRDIFSPVAAHLATGVTLSDVGQPLSRPLVQLELPCAKSSEQGLDGEVLWTDHFGNLITNLKPVRPLIPGTSVELSGGRSIPVLPYYAAADSGVLIALIGSSGRLEIAVRNGSAAEYLQADAGFPVGLRWSRHSGS